MIQMAAKIYQYTLNVHKIVGQVSNDNWHDMVQEQNFQPALQILGKFKTVKFKYHSSDCLKFSVPKFVFG